MSIFLKRGENFFVTTHNALNMHDALPVGNYTVDMDAMTKEFFLKPIEAFKPVGKLYGETQKHTDRILTTFDSRAASTGVLLAGEKGSGKSLLAKNLSIQGISKGIPTIVINNAWCGDSFNKFIQQINQPAIVIFDEFEKVYDKDDQELLLTLLDGVYPSKKLFVLTCNDTYRVNSHMKNRPGRIFYMIEYEGLDKAFIREYCEDNLIYKNFTEEILRLSAVFDTFNFDMLKAMVEEVNRYNESPKTLVSMLNTKPTGNSDSSFTIVMIKHNGNNISISQLHKDFLEIEDINPFNEGFSFSFRVKNDKKSKKKEQTPQALGIDEEDAEYIWCHASYEVEELTSVDFDKGYLKFEKTNGDYLILQRKERKKFNWAAF